MKDKKIVSKGTYIALTGISWCIFIGSLCLLFLGFIEMAQAFILNKSIVLSLVLITLSIVLLIIFAIMIISVLFYIKIGNKKIPDYTEIYGE